MTEIICLGIFQWSVVLEHKFCEILLGRYGACLPRAIVMLTLLVIMAHVVCMVICGRNFSLYLLPSCLHLSFLSICCLIGNHLFAPFLLNWMDFVLYLMSAGLACATRSFSLISLYGSLL